MDNWIAEFRKWAPDVQLPSKIIGPNGTLVAKTFVNYKGDALRVVLGSYERMRGDMQNLLSRAGINLVVCDEAHRLKNMQTQCARARTSRPATVVPAAPSSHASPQPCLLLCPRLSCSQGSTRRSPRSAALARR